MEEIIIERYQKEKKDEWNRYVNTAKNSLFLFYRDYMDYHNDRFLDHSLMFYKNNNLIALIPANEKNSVLYSHGGLTYGGLIVNDKIRQSTVNNCFEALNIYARHNGIDRIHFKPIPHIYHKQPAEEEIYALYSYGAKIDEIAASTVIDLSNPLKIDRDRKGHINRAKREGVEIHVVVEKEYYDEFITMENEVLKRHNTKAVHTADELYMLHERFPHNIHLIGAFVESKFVAGVVVYESDQVVHTQYMATNDFARSIGALDMIVFSIIERYKKEKKWIDFGISTEHGRMYLNEGLISQKEGFGGRTNIYQLWVMEFSK